jgi:hypothetical protein
LFATQTRVHETCANTPHHAHLTERRSSARRRRCPHTHRAHVATKRQRLIASHTGGLTQRVALLRRRARCRHRCRRPHFRCARCARAIRNRRAMMVAVAGRRRRRQRPCRLPRRCPGVSRRRRKRERAPRRVIRRPAHPATSKKKRRECVWGEHMALTVRNFTLAVAAARCRDQDARAHTHTPKINGSTLMLQRSSVVGGGAGAHVPAAAAPCGTTEGGSQTPQSPLACASAERGQ